MLAGTAADPWAAAETGLARALAADPPLERELLDTPLEELSPADRFFRAQILEERGDFAAAGEAAAAAEPGLYTAATLAARDRLLDVVATSLEGTDGPIVDVATGRGTLLERLARSVDRPLVATDVSPNVLTRTRARLRAPELGDRISYVACDARRTPFRDGAAAALTSFLGLANIREPGPLLSELRRIAGGPLLAVTQLYPEDDEANAGAIRSLGLERLLYRDGLLAELADAGWLAEIRGAELADAVPTPAGVLLAGARIDGLPVAPTVLEWCLVEATPA